jgi:hypothetical protein
MQGDTPGDQPYSWIDRWVEVGVLGAHGGMQTTTGWLITVNELGLTLRRETRSGDSYEQFYPWSAVANIRPLPEYAPSPSAYGSET